MTIHDLAFLLVWAVALACGLTGASLVVVWLRLRELEAEAQRMRKQ